MALIGINMPSANARKPSTLDKIAQGVGIATEILGTGVKGYGVIKDANNATQAAEDRFASDFKTASPEEAQKGLAETVKGRSGQYVRREKPGDPYLDALKMQLQQNQLTSGALSQTKAKMDIVKAEDEIKHGRQLSETYVNKLSEASILPEELKGISKMVDGSPDFFDPIVGRARALNPYDSDAQLLQSKLKTTAQQVGKFLEDGVLRKEDEIKYEKMLPQIGDTPETAKGKSAIVFEKLKKRFVQLRENLDKSRYDTRAFDGHPLDTMKIEEIVGGAKRASESVGGSALKAGDVDGGHQFLGGDPNNPKSWKVVQ